MQPRFLFFGCFLITTLFSCSKGKQYTCSEDCENYTIQVNLTPLNDSFGSLQIPYSIYFLPESNTWFDYPGTEFEVANGQTDVKGVFRKTIKVNKKELEGAKGIYIRLYPSATLHLCKNPALLTVLSEPVNNTAQFFMDAYHKKSFTLSWQKQSVESFDQTEIIYGSPTTCTFGFNGKRDINTPSGNVAVEALLNQYLYITVKETQFGSPNTYRWTSDSVFVDAATTSHHVMY